MTNTSINVQNSSNVVINSILKDTQLIAGSLPGIDADQTKRLQALLVQLQEALPKVSADKTDQAQDVALQAKDFVDEAAKSPPNKSRLKRLGEGLKTTANFLKEGVPAVATVAGSIVDLIAMIHGL